MRDPDFADGFAKVSSTAVTKPSISKTLVAASVKSGSRKAVAGEMFYEPGGATTRAVAEMYDVIELAPQNGGPQKGTHA